MKPDLIIENTNSNESSGQLTLYKNTSSPANSDIIGVLGFKSNNSEGYETQYNYIMNVAVEVTDDAEDGGMLFSVLIDGVPSPGIFLLDGARPDF